MLIFRNNGDFHPRWEGDLPWGGGKGWSGESGASGEGSAERCRTTLRVQLSACNWATTMILTTFFWLFEF